MHTTTEACSSISKMLPHTLPHWRWTGKRAINTSYSKLPPYGLDFSLFNLRSSKSMVLLPMLALEWRTRRRRRWRGMEEEEEEKPIDDIKGNVKGRFCWANGQASRQAHTHLLLLSVRLAVVWHQTTTAALIQHVVLLGQHKTSKWRRRRRSRRWSRIGNGKIRLFLLRLLYHCYCFEGANYRKWVEEIWQLDIYILVYIHTPFHNALPTKEQDRRATTRL